SPRLASRRQRALFTTASIVSILAAILFLVPAPSSTRAEGVIWAPDEAQVRATVDGFVTAVLVKPDQTVRQGDLVIQTEDPELGARSRVLQAQLAELDARYNATILTKRVQAEVINEQKKHVVEQLEL